MFHDWQATLKLEERERREIGVYNTSCCVCWSSASNIWWHRDVSWTCFSILQFRILMKRGRTKAENPEFHLKGTCIQNCIQYLVTSTTSCPLFKWMVPGDQGGRQRQLARQNKKHRWRHVCNLSPITTSSRITYTVSQWLDTWQNCSAMASTVWDSARTQINKYLSPQGTSKSREPE